MPSVRTAFLYADGFIDMPAYGQAHGVGALHPSFDNLQYPDFMAECRAKKLDVNVWTVNSEADLAVCVREGVHAIITNYPDKARTASDKFSIDI